MRNLLRNLAYASVVVAALTFTLHLLGRPAKADPSSAIVAATASSGLCSSGTVVLSNGDVYDFAVGSGCSPHTTYLGNIWGSLPIAVEPSTWSQIKSGR